MSQGIRHSLAAVLVALAAGAAHPQGEDAAWPQWRGPDRDGQAPGFEAPVRWPARLEKLWRVEVGHGHSGPVVAGDRIYLFVRDERGESAEARRLGDGSLLWRRSYPTAYRVTSEARWHGRGPFSTPLVADGVLYTYGIAEVLSAWRASDGELLWRRDFGQEFETPWTYYGTSLSPILTAGKVIVHAGGPGAGALVALDATTGDERWRLGGEGPPYGSAIVTELDGVRQLVSLTQNRLIGVDPETGGLLWSRPFKVGYDNTVQTPLVAAGLLVMAAWETPARGFRVRRGEVGWTAAVEWETPQSAIAYTSPVSIGGRVWGFSHHDSGRLYRLDPESGRIDWRGAPRRGEHASLVAAGERLLVFTDDGRLEVFDTTAAEPASLAAYEVTSSAQWAHPALFGRHILVKGQGELVLWRLPGADAG